MLIEAAKGGHTGVVSVLIDYNPNNLSASAAAAVAAAAASGAANTEAPPGDVVSDTAAVDLGVRFQAEGHEDQHVPAPPTPASTSTATSTSAQNAPAATPPTGQQPAPPSSLPNKSK